MTPLIYGAGAFAAIYFGSKLLSTKAETLPGDKDPTQEPVEPKDKDTQPAPNPLASQIAAPSGVSAKYPNGIPEPSAPAAVPGYMDTPRVYEESNRLARLGGSIAREVFDYSDPKNATVAGNDIDPTGGSINPPTAACTDCSAPSGGTNAVDRYASKSLGGTRLFF